MNKIKTSKLQSLNEKELRKIKDGNPYLIAIGAAVGAAVNPGKEILKKDG